MSQNRAPIADDFTPGRPVVFRNATVLTIDPSLGMIAGGDVLVADKRIATSSLRPSTLATSRSALRDR